MPQLAEITAYQAAIDDVSTLTIAELLRFWRTLDLTDPVPAVVQIREFVPELVDTYSPIAGEVAASFYDESRTAAGVAGSYLADIAPPPKSDWLQTVIGWAVAPLFRKTSVVGDSFTVDLLDQFPDPDPKLATSRLGQGAQIAVANTARDTIDLNIGKDPAKPRYGRHASANACAFCALMATRGAVYRSEASAGKKYHGHCHCVAYAEFPGEVTETPPYVLEWESAYQSARKSAIKAGQPADLTNVLHYMRQTTGAA